MRLLLLARSGRTRPQQPRFSIIIVSLTLWDDVQDATWAHEMDGNFWRSGTSTYQRSCKINFFTITHCSTQAFIRAMCSFATGEKWLWRLLADTASPDIENLSPNMS